MDVGTAHLLNPFVSGWTLRLCLCLGQVVQSAAGKIQELGSSSREVLSSHRRKGGIFRS